jgi:hypothetical protein
VTTDTNWIKADVCSYVSDRSCLFVGVNDELYVMCAVAMDYKGNYSEMWMSEPFSFALTPQTKRDINEFLDKLGLESEAQRAGAKSANSVDISFKALKR